MSESGTLQTSAAALSINEACGMIGVGRSRLYKLISEGRLPARKIGRRTVILRDDALAVLRDAPMLPTRAV